jgi:isopropylmalate/homocitrate/citramalate synthase
MGPRHEPTEGAVRSSSSATPLVSGINTDPELEALYHWPEGKSVGVIDSTIRKLDYTAGVRLSTDQRVELALASEALGAEEIYINNLHFDPSYAAAAAAIMARRTRLNLSIQTFLTDRWQEGLDAALEIRPDYCEVEARTSPQELERDGSTPDEMARRLAAAMEYGASRGASMTAGFMDCTRAEMPFLVRLARDAAALGALKIVLYDSFGCLTPDAFRVLVQRIREGTEYDIPIAVHVHDAFGLATACTVAAVSGGASMVDCAAYGLPTHLRLAPLEETVLALELLFNVSTGMNLGGLYEYSRFVEATGGVPRASYQPVSGEHRFITDSEPGLLSYLRGEEPLARPYQPAILARTETPVWTIGAVTTETITAKLAQLGIEPTEELMQGVNEQLLTRITNSASYPHWISDTEVTRVCGDLARGKN